MTTINRRRNPLFNCSNKKYFAEFLTRNSDFCIKKADLRNFGRILDLNDKIFYEHKKSKLRSTSEPSSYSDSSYRKFYSPSKERKFFLRRVNRALQTIQTPNYLVSVPRKSYINNALIHRGNSRYIMLDISNFFPSCSYNMIRNFFISDSGLRMSEDIAAITADLVTVYDKQKKKRIVPQGYPTSTLIAFFAYKKMFDELNDFSSSQNIKMTVYVDDLTFSYSDNIFIDPELFCLSVVRIVTKYGHKINLEKKNVYYCDNPEMQIKVPVITGVFLKRWKVRASPKMHSNLIKSFNKISSMQINNRQDYFKYWKLYLKLNGQLLTIDLIEPEITRESRSEVRKYLYSNRNNIPYETNYNRIKDNNLEDDLFLAYKRKELRDFMRIHSDILFDNFSRKTTCP